MANILVVDDEKDVVDALAIYLSDYTVFKAYNGKEALDILNKEKIHLVLMDIMMPVMDGITAMAKIRETSNVPIILLSAKTEDSDKITGLNFGADDYITKPFNPLEVSARIHSQLRRYFNLGTNTSGEEIYINGAIVMNNMTKTVLLDGKEIPLTPKEYMILKLLMANPGKVYSPKDIYEIIWKERPYGSDNTVAVHIRHLREKIESDPADPKYIKVIFGQGYKMEKFKD